MTRKTAFFEGWSWFKFNNLGLALGTNLKFCTILVKGLKLKVRKFLGPNPTFVEVTGGKLVGGPFWSLLILNWVKNRGSGGGGGMLNGKNPLSVTKVICRQSLTANSIQMAYWNARNLLASTFYLPSEDVAISVGNYNYNHNNLPFSHIMIMVIISDEDMLK